MSITNKSLIVGIILCAGHSNRMQSGTPKCLLKLKGKPVFIYSVEAFLALKEVDHVYVVADEDHVMDYKEELIKYGLIRRVKLIIGSSISRHESLKLAIRKVNFELHLIPEDIIVSHDGARPTVTAEIIDQNIRKTRRFSVSSTVQGDNRNTLCISTKVWYRTLSARRTYAVLTPQAFTYRLWDLSCKVPRLGRNDYPDACSFLIKKPIAHSLVKAPQLNFKMTYPQDYDFAKYVVYEK